MKRLFTNEDFEDFLKTNSNRFQMRPSDKVWQAISDDLGRKRRRIGWLTSLFIFALSGIAYYLSVNSNENIPQQAALQDKTFNGTGNNINNGIAPVTLQTTPVTKINTTTTRSHLIKDSRKKSPLYVAFKQPDINQPVAFNQPAATDESTAFSPTIVDSDPSFLHEKPVEKKSFSLTDPALSIESVTNIFKSQQKSKLNFELFFTPTISYRKLSENKGYMQSPARSGSTSGVAALYNVNDAVTHKPNIGLELGLTAKYPVTENIRLKAGVQFNMSRYDIKAFTNYTEAATMAFRNGSTTMSASNYRNLEGEKPDWLQNVYYQVSAPVGLEMKLGRVDKTQFGVASTVQPTYMMGDRAYLISTDYKNYVEVPWLVRRWNVNTALETFVTYSTGKVHWQVGPQVRYQILSSFISNYPVKENLFDFGLKIGVTLNKSSGSSGSKQ
jgi:hypothetical protein